MKWKDWRVSFAFPAGPDDGSEDHRLPYPGEYSESSEEESEEDAEEKEINQFRIVSEIRFPSEIGPLGDRRLCKIKCVKGKWVGPLCAASLDEGTVQFIQILVSLFINWDIFNLIFPSNLLLLQQQNFTIPNALQKL